MKITLSNIRHLDSAPTQKRCFAIVTTTMVRGWWRWRTVTKAQRMIYSDDANRWRFVGTGEHIPDELMQPLYDEFSQWGKLRGAN